MNDVVDVRFGVKGEAPRDHGYRLFSALARYLPEAHVHRDESETPSFLGVHPLGGTRLPGQRLLTTTLTLRVPRQRVKTVQILRGRTLCLEPKYRERRPDADKICVADESPEVCPLRPAPVLEGPVYFQLHAFDRQHLTAEEERTVFFRALRYYLKALDVRAFIDLLWPFRMKVHIHLAVGMHVRLSNLSDEDSLRVQALGLGKRRTMGCGHLVPLTDKHLYDEIVRLRWALHQRTGHGL